MPPINVSETEAVDRPSQTFVEIPYTLLLAYISASCFVVVHDPLIFKKFHQEGNEIIILKKGKEVARLISKDTGISFLTDSLTGILKKDYNEKDIRAERIAEKYENID